MTPEPAYKRPIQHGGRTYYFYNYREDELRVYMANKRSGERENKIILVDKLGNTIGEGLFRDHRKNMG